jgi:hypothetical protein
MGINMNRAHRHTLGPVSNEVPESTIAAQPDLHNPDTNRSIRKMIKTILYIYTSTYWVWIFLTK